MARNEHDKELARQSKTVALVIVGAMVLWISAQYLGPRLGLPDRYVFLFDLAALAAFVWAFYVTFQIWRKRHDDNQG